MVNLITESMKLGVHYFHEHKELIHPDELQRFNRYKETIKVTRKPIVFSQQIIRQTFSNSVDLFGNVLRDSEANFTTHMREEGFQLTYNDAKQTWTAHL